MNVTTHSLGLARNLGRTEELLGRAMNKLGSGTRLERPADDPVAVGTTSRLDAQGQRVKAALSNVQNGVSFVQTASSYLNQMEQALTRMSELATLSKDPTKSTNDIALYQVEFVSLQEQLRETIGGTLADIGGTADVSDPLAQFNNRPLFKGGSTITVTIGSASDQQLELPGFDFTSGLFAEVIRQDGAGVFTLSADDADSVAKLVDAVGIVTAALSDLGATGSRLDYASGALTVEQENLIAVNSRLRDVDTAKESTRLSSLQMRSEAGTAMLTQSNQSSESVLRLLQQL